MLISLATRLLVNQIWTTLQLIHDFFSFQKKVLRAFNTLKASVIYFGNFIYVLFGFYLTHSNCVFNVFNLFLIHVSIKCLY